MIFSGFNESFENLYQSIRRAYREGQTQSVRVHFAIVEELEGDTFANLARKAAEHERDTNEMEERYIEAGSRFYKERSMTIVEQAIDAEGHSPQHRLHHGDGRATRARINRPMRPTAIPFEELFQYSNKVEDVGNSPTTNDIRAGRFALNMRFFIEQLYRVMRPGCNVCIHIQQLLAFKNTHGFIGRRDFRGACVDMFCAGGFIWPGEFVIQKNPQRIAQELNLISLQFKSGWASVLDRVGAVP